MSLTKELPMFPRPAPTALDAMLPSAFLPRTVMSASSAKEPAVDPTLEAIAGAAVDPTLDPTTGAAALRPLNPPAVTPVIAPLMRAFSSVSPVPRLPAIEPRPAPAPTPSIPPPRNGASPIPPIAARAAGITTSRKPLSFGLLAYTSLNAVYGTPALSAADTCS